MIIYRVFNHHPDSATDPLAIDVTRQKRGRFSIPNLDAVIYASLEKVSVVSETIQHLRNLSLSDNDFEGSDGFHKAMAEIEIPNNTKLLDLRKAEELKKHAVPPAHVVTGNREITQSLSAKIFREGFEGFIWCSAIESTWSNLTLFKSRLKSSQIVSIKKLNIRLDAVIESAQFLRIKFKHSQA